MKARPPDAVVTAVTTPASADRVWESLLLFEQIARRPPLLLRLLLPTPIGTEGRMSPVGAETRCLYERGFLRKRSTRIERGHAYEFDVVEQRLPIGGGIRLLGGGYRLESLEGGSTRIALETRYDGRRRPRWLWRPIEALVCRAFHRHLLEAMDLSANLPEEGLVGAEVEG